jgi:hypothetical protein
MANTQLVDYILKARAARATEDQIRLILSDRGWSIGDVDDAFAMASKMGSTGGGKKFPIKYIAFSLAVILIAAGGYFAYQYLTNLKGKGVDADASKIKVECPKDKDYTYPDKCWRDKYQKEEPSKPNSPLLR